MDFTPTPEEEEYLKSRGFKFFCREPHDDESCPYVVIKRIETKNKYGEVVFVSDIIYQETKHESWDTYKEILGMHPSYSTEDHSVKLVERIVTYDINLEGKLFTTKPGKPIKVFVTDPAWKGALEKLVKKYSKK